MRSSAWVFFLFLASQPSSQEPAKSPECREWQACRQLALDAAARQDYEQFHDLAWRTLQLGPKNDPALMMLVARAQSLSGRPHDALVMLRRVAAVSSVADAATSEDFERVRALPQWAELEALIAGKAGSPPAPGVAKPEPTKPTTPTPSTTPPAKPSSAAAPPPEVTVAKPEKPLPPAKEAPAARGSKSGASGKSPPGVPAALVFPASGLAATGLGYDAVSGRFLVGDRQARRLVVVGERSGRLASLAGTDAGFNEVTSFEIDVPEGDLWVVSASATLGSSSLHKLQLISGRVLAAIPLPADAGPARFIDVAVAPQNIYVLDTDGRRIFRAAKKGRTLELAARIAVPGVASLTSSSDNVCYAAYDLGILRIDVAARALAVVEPAERADVSGLQWIRWHRGSLVGIQRIADGGHRLLRIRLDDAGRTIRGVDVLETRNDLAGPTSATISGNTLYYLVRTTDGDGIEVKRLTLK